MKYLIVLFALIPRISYSAAYLDVGSMQNDLSIYTLNDSGEVQKEDLKTNFINIAFGYFLSNSTAFEFGVTDGKMNGLSREISSGDYELSGNINIYHFGFRWFAFESLNFKSGVAKLNINPQFESSSIEAPKDINKFDSENSAYIGVGIGATFTSFQVFYDFITYPLKNRDDLHLNLIDIFSKQPSYKLMNIQYLLIDYLYLILIS